MAKIVCCSGGFDPCHRGHINYLNSARQLGDSLIVGVNSDAWLTRKKGRPFMPWTERQAIIGNLRSVDQALAFDDSDGTAISLLEELKQMYPDDEIIFANGGDRNEKNIPEMTVSGVTFAFGVGGENKANSSSWILEEWKSPKTIRPWGWYRVLDENAGCKVKELVIQPGQSLSMQRHQYRSEHWYVLRGQCVVKVDQHATQVWLDENQTYVIPAMQWHQACNPGTDPCHILEVQYGEQCTESDIERM